MEANLRIDLEFQSKIPPLTQAEFEQLKENILTAGEVYEPLVVWNDIIVDGHNRFKIIQEHPEVNYRIRKMDFIDKWEAFDWMYKNQLGRRNLTSEQRTYLLGKLYEARKHMQGGDRRSETFSSSQNANLKGIRIGDQIAQEQKVGKGTVNRAYEYSRGIDAIKEEEPELAESLLKAETKVSKTSIQEIGIAKPEEQSEMIQALKGGEKPEKPVVQRRSKEEIKKEKEDMQEIGSIWDEMRKEETQAEYTVNSLLQDIELNVSMPFVRLLRQYIESNRSICTQNKQAVVKAIHENITVKVDEIEKEIEGYE